MKWVTKQFNINWYLWNHKDIFLHESYLLMLKNDVSGSILITPLIKSDIFKTVLHILTNTKMATK